MPSKMARRKKVQQLGEFVLFDVLYEDGTRSSNRKVPRSELGSLDGDRPRNPISRHRIERSLQFLENRAARSSRCPAHRSGKAQEQIQERMMARKPNYRFERAERNRAKEAKKEEKLKRQQERASARSADETPEPTSEPAQN
jgi:flagellar biosynthesis GTPase FlhF